MPFGVGMRGYGSPAVSGSSYSYEGSYEGRELIEKNEAIKVIKQMKTPNLVGAYFGTGYVPGFSKLKIYIPKDLPNLRRVARGGSWGK